MYYNFGYPTKWGSDQCTEYKNSIGFNDGRLKSDIKNSNVSGDSFRIFNNLQIVNPGNITLLSQKTFRPWHFQSLMPAPASIND